MTPILAFSLAFLVTLVLLAIVVWSGVRARRHVHIPFVGLTVASLAVTIYYAYRLGYVLDLDAAGVITPIHLFLARTATLAIVIAIVFGLRTLVVPRSLRTHKRLAWLALALIVLAAITGVAMVALAPTIQPG